MSDNTNVIPGFGALMPSQPYDLPPDRTPRVPIPDPLQFDNISPADREREALNQLRRTAANTYDPASLVEPIRWEDPSYEKLQQTFDNADRGYRFQSLGFMPGRDNEDYFAKDLTRWEKMGLAWDQMGELAKTTFVEQWETEASFWGNLATGQVKDAFAPFGDQQELQNIYDTMQSISNRNYIPLTFDERAGDYGFGKFATALGQFGFTLGTIGAFSTQLALEFGLAALLAPESGGASIIAAGASVTNKVRRGLTIANMFRNLSRLENTAASANRIKQAYNYLTNTKNLKAGLGKFYTFSKMYNAAAGEAKFEAAFSYGEHVDREMEKAKDAGIILTPENKAKIEQDALAIAMNNGLTNTGLLYVMNRLNMNSIFRGPFNAQKRYLTELASNIDRDLIKVGGKTISRFEIPTFSKAGLKQAGAGALKWTANSAWEGVQEVAQGISAEYWENYYQNKYNRDKYDPLFLLGKTISHRLDSNEAFEEFVAGFIIGAPGTMVNTAIGKTVELVNRQQITDYRKAVSDYAKLINEYEKDPFRIFDQRVANTNTQFSISNQMDEAVRTNNIYAYKNLVKEQLRDMVMLGIRTGKLDYMISTLKDQVANLSDEDFAQQFGMVSDSTNRKKASDYVNLLEKKANTILQEYDKTKQLFANPYSNFKGVKKGSPEETNQKLKYQAWEDAVQDLVFEKDTYLDTLERMKSILGDSSEYIGDALYNTYYMMTSDRSVEKEIILLRSEIQSDLEIPNPDNSIKDRIKRKKRQLDALTKWRQSYTELTSLREGPQPNQLLFTKEDLEGRTERVKSARSSFEEVLNAYQEEEALNPLTPEGIQKAYQGILDFFQLQQDSQTAVKNISFLASPEGFEQNFELRARYIENEFNKIIEKRKEIVERREKVLEALEQDAEFANRPDILELRRHLNDAMVNSEFDSVEVIMRMIEQIYENGTLDEVQQDQQAAVSADIPLVNEIVEEETGNVTYRISHEGIEYEVFGEEPDLFYVVRSDGALDAIEAINVPQSVKDALKDYIDQKQTKQTPISPQVVQAVPGPPSDQSTQTGIKFIDLLNRILTADEATLAMLAQDMQNNLDKDPYKNFNTAELAEIYDAFDTREKELSSQKAKPKPVSSRSENDADFVREYNEALIKVKQIVEAPNVTVQEVKAAFATLQPILNTLADKAVRNKYVAGLLVEQNAIIDRINKINNSKNPGFIKKNIDEIFNTSPSFTKAIDDIVVLIENSVDPSIKDEVIAYFDEAFKKKIDEQVNTLKSLASGGITSDVIKQYANQTNDFRNKVIASIQELDKLSADIAEESAKNDYNLAVDIDESFTNPTHRYIIENIPPTIKSTAGQAVAIRNLVSSGMLLEQEVNATNDEILVEASDLINRGVARIYTVGINKELHRFFVLNKTDRRSELENVMAAYISDQEGSDIKEAKDYAKEIIDTAIQAGRGIEDVLEALNIPKTSVISDEHRDLLEKQRKLITDLLRNGSTLDIISYLDSRQKTLMESGATDVTPEVFVDGELINKISKLTKKDSDKGELKTDLIDFIKYVQSETDVKAATKKLNGILYKHASSNAKAAANLKNILISVASYYSETQSAMANNETSREPLTVDEMLSVLSGNSVPMTLSQINQLDEYAKTQLLEEARKRFSALSGYTGSIEFDPQLIPEPAGAIRVKFSTLRIKDATDLRTTADLNEQLGVQNNTFNAHTALNMIINSEFATEAERIIAGKLLGIVAADEMIMVNNTQTDLGVYDPETNTITINLEAVGYAENTPTYPVETLILHEMLHRVIENEAANPKSEFYRQIRSVIEAVKSSPASKTFYAFQGNLTEDEQVREFVIEALTNPAFQYHLSKIQYAKSNKTVWQKFMELLTKLFENLGVTVDGTALGETLSVVNDLLRYKNSEETLSRISNANREQLIELRKEVEESTEFIPSIQDAMLSMINQKLDGYKMAEAYAKVKMMTQFKASDGRTYYYGLINGVLEVMTKSRKGYKPVRKESIRLEIINNAIKNNTISKLIPQGVIETLQNIAGDPATKGSYASGMMINDGMTVGEQRFPNAQDTKITLQFRSVDEYNAFKREYWSAKRTGQLKTGKLDELKSKYGISAVANYGELVYALGERKSIDKLVTLGFIKIAKSGANMEDIISDTSLTQDELFDMYNYILQGGKLNVSEYSNISDYINRTLSKVFKAPINAELQSKIESKILQGEPTEVEEIPETADQELVVSSELPQDAIQDAAAYAFTDEIETTNTAIENNPLRSYSPDGYTDFKTGDFVENEAYKNFYFKVREIVNALSVKNASELAGLMVTFDKDNAMLRWDGSAQSQGWIDADKGVIGYISDMQGNPVVFNKKGQVVGKLDRNNLSDEKGLNDGQNQIVYFTIFADPNKPAAKAAQKANPEQFAMLMEMRKKVMSGTPIIASVTRVSPGQFNKKVLVNPTNKNRQDTRNDEFYDQLMQPNIYFTFSKTSGTLIANVRDLNGAVNSFGLFAPNARYVKITVNGQEYSLSDYLFQLLQVYNEVALRDPRLAERIQQDLVVFNNNMWLTGADKNQQIPKNMRRIGIKEYITNKEGKKIPTLNYYNLFNIQGDQITLREDDAKVVRNHLNNQPLNVWSKWLSGDVDFKFPVIGVNANGERTITFVNKNYKEFLFKEVGMKSNVVEIPQEQYLKAYNSIVHFTEGADLTIQTPITAPTTQDLIDNPKAIQDSVKDKGDDVKLDDDELNSLNKGKRFKVPGYTEIFEKICR